MRVPGQQYPSHLGSPAQCATRPHRVRVGYLDIRSMTSVRNWQNLHPAPLPPRLPKFQRRNKYRLAIKQAVIIISPLCLADSFNGPGAQFLHSSRFRDLAATQFFQACLSQLSCDLARLFIMLHSSPYNIKHDKQVNKF